MSPGQAPIPDPRVVGMSTRARFKPGTVHLPADVVDRIRDLHAVEPVPGVRTPAAAAAKEPLDDLLLELHEAGWSGAILGDALGTTRDMAGRRIARAQLRRDPDVAVRDVSWIRRPVPPNPKLQRRLTLAAGRSQRGLWGVVADEHARGVSLREIAAALGVSRGTVQRGLSDHGYRPVAPSRQAQSG